MGNKPAKLDRFDKFLPPSPWESPWSEDGSFKSDAALLRDLLASAAGSSQASGILAAASDVWVAHELRRAGFDPDEVWPRAAAPRVMPRDIASMLRDKKGLTVKVSAALEERLPKLKKALPAEANVLGAVYTKQADVLIASWSAGIELMVSTKTMLSSFAKNLRNRFEEAYGDARNLRSRHPLAALGFLYILSAKASADDRAFAEDMLRKLEGPHAYDAVTLVVIDTDAAIDDESEDDEDTRGPMDESASLVTASDAGDEEPDEEAQPESDEQPEGDDATAPAALALLDVPRDLHPDRFFQVLIEAALERTPIAMYPGVRSAVEAARS